jgi:hypothetical protein
MMAVLQLRDGWAGVLAAGRKEIPNMVSVTLETRAAKRSAFGMGFIVVPLLHIDRIHRNLWPHRTILGANAWPMVLGPLLDPPQQVAAAQNPRS